MYAIVLVHPGIARLPAAGPHCRRWRISEDYEEAVSPASVGVGRARTQEADWAGGAVDVYLGVARGARYPLHYGPALTHSWGGGVQPISTPGEIQSSVGIPISPKQTACPLTYCNEAYCYDHIKDSCLGSVRDQGLSSPPLSQISLPQSSQPLLLPPFSYIISSTLKAPSTAGKALL